MNVFEAELKNGRFVVPECPRCQKIIWPPSEYCTRCFGNVIWRTVNDSGILVEYSSKDGKMFCIAEFEKIRIMGSFHCEKTPVIGQKIKISSCGFDNSPKFTFSQD
jgi:uncharacterized OB-fold protein